MRLTIVLFDIDGTLLLTGGAGRRAMEGAFAEFCGCPDACAHFSFHGMTDRAIAREGLRAVAHPAPEEAIGEVLDLYLERLVAEVATSADYRVMPGVHAVLEALGERADVALGLGTGNLRRGAEVKLARVGLSDAFGFGGFGCDHEERSELLRIGAKRGAAQLGAEVAACRVVIVGDTPRDVTAALAVGAACIGVGTGGFAPAELRAEGATDAFDDLEQPGVLEAVLGPRAGECTAGDGR